MRDRTDIDYVFRESFSDFKVAPSDDVWIGLETQLKHSNKQIYKNRGRKRLLLVLFGFLFLGGALYMLTIESTDTISTNKYTNDSFPQNGINENKHQVVSVGSGQNKSLDAVKNNLRFNSKGSNIDPKPDAQVSANKLIEQEAKINTVYPLSALERLNEESNHVIDLSNGDTDIFQIEHSYSASKSKLSKINGQYNEKERIQEPPLLDFKSIKLYNTAGSQPDFVQSMMPVKIWPLQPNSFRHRIAIQAIYQYNYSYRKITGQGKKFFDQRERQGNVHSYGLRIDISIDKSLRFQSGLDLQNQALYRGKMVESKYIGNNQSETLLSTSFNTNKVLFTLNNSEDLNIGELVSIAGVFRQETKWINIPLNLIYRIKKRHFAIDMSGGISTNLFLSDKIIFKESQKKTLDFMHTFSESSAQTYLSYNGGISVHYLNNSFLDLFIGLHYQNAFTSATKSKTIKYYPYLYGVQIGGIIPVLHN